MSRKTAVCLLFVFFLASVATALPAPGKAACTGSVSVCGAAGPAHLAAGDAKVGDPDGLTAPGSFTGNGLVPAFLRFLVRSFLL